MSSSPKITGKLTPVTEETKSVEMDFFDAIREVLEGRKVARASWNNEEYVRLWMGTLRLFKSDKAFFDWIIVEADMTGTDWIIVV